ncbi:protein timeless-like isoform X4 [Platichthys flesus]|uniref:protein timeless-like isoform X3 n=1 Tax=Platichthys flesus TaxID=8260 RepID=UPI002DBF9CB6|nr:protein timeless-like isoform X3 [Platichthys flesus]XP_062264276.1 protein timeless-like isoform X4 [Platichthys flesus]
MSPWFLVVLSAALSVSLVVLTLACVNCWRRRPLVSIRQTHASEDYTPSTEFRVRVIHPMQPSSDLNSIRSAPHLLSPPRVLSSSDGTQRSHRSFTPTETDSNPSYENPADGPDYVNPDPNLPDSDVEDPGYIIVIPGCEALASSNQSRASSPSSDVRHDYVNLGEEEAEEEEEEEEEPEEPDYLNVDLQLSQKAAAESSGHSDSDSDSDEDVEGNYVNQPPMIHSPQSLMGRRLTDRNQ